VVQRLKRWESPRRQGRNDKGKGGSARQRQLKKQQQMLRKKLKDNAEDKSTDRQEREGREINLFPFIFTYFHSSLKRR
jgi:predicted transcriptional regulator